MQETIGQSGLAGCGTRPSARGDAQPGDANVDLTAEHAALSRSVGLLDLSHRGRLRIMGCDWRKFLHGQVTNQVENLRPGQGCYAALADHRAHVQSDLNLYGTADGALLDFEPGCAEIVTERLRRFVFRADVQFEDAADRWGLLSLQGPESERVLRDCGPGAVPGRASHDSVVWSLPDLGEVVVARHARLGSVGFDLFVPTGRKLQLLERLREAFAAAGGRVCGGQAFEVARIEAGIPRFGVDMDDSNLLPETGIEDRAVSYTKGCYVGQEVIARIRTYGQVAKALRGLRLWPGLEALPVRGDRLQHEGREVGFVTSATWSLRLGIPIALGYVRREVNAPGTALRLRTGQGEVDVAVVPLPFRA